MSAGDGLPAPEVEEVRVSSDVYADAIEAEQAEKDAPLTIKLGEATLRARSHRPAGAWSVFCARVKSSNPVIQSAAPLHLLERWIVEEDHDALHEAFTELDDLEHWAQHEFPKLVEALIQRPTSAP